MHQPSGQMLSLSQFVHLCVCVSVCVSGCLFTFEIPLKRLSVPNSRSQMSKIFRDSEFLGKSYGKKWSQTWNFLLIIGVKLLHKTKVCFLANFSVVTRIFCIGVFFFRLTVFLPSPNFLDFWNPWGKVIERSGLRFENFGSWRV